MYNNGRETIFKYILYMNSPELKIQEYQTHTSWILHIETKRRESQGKVILKASIEKRDCLKMKDN